FSSRRRHTRSDRDWSSDVCSSDLKALAPLDDKRIAVLGLAFKANTDDMREAKSIEVGRHLVELGAQIRAYDPVAMDNARRVLPRSEERRVGKEWRSRWWTGRLRGE